MTGFLKALARFIAPRSLVGGSFLPRSSFNYQRTVGKGFRSSVVMAPVHWIARTFPQAVLRVELDGEAVAEHGLTQLVSRPNGFYGGAALWMSTIFSYVLSGNAYWLIVRDERTLEPIELWYAPHWLMKPVQGGDGSEFISRYDYQPRGQKIPLDPQDVIHFRYGLDPENITLGISPLASLWREIFTDDEASNFTASLLKNMGMAGMVISPAKGVKVLNHELQETRKYITERLTGDRRGQPLVMSAGTEVGQMAFSPQQMTLAALRDVPEERVCAVLGIPAAVVGFGTGLQQTKVGATMREMIRLAWTSNLIPMGVAFASELERCLLPEFEPRPEGARLFFSTDHVEALQDDANNKADRAAKLFAGGIITRGEARSTTGYQAEDRDDIFLVPASAIEVEADTPKEAGGGVATKDDPYPLFGEGKPNGVAAVN